MDTREFKRLEHPADFKRIDNYVDSIDPSTVGLSRVIQPYFLRSNMRCGLTTCHQEHREGYLVELSDGRLSNIGHICGSSPENFGESFSAGVARLTEAHIRIDASRRLQDRAGIIARFNEARKITEEVRVWMPRVGGLLLTFNLGELLRMRLARGEREILEARERSAQEITNLVESGQYRTRDAARYEERSIGTIQGLEAVKLNFSPAGMLKASDALRLIDPLEMSTQDLLEHVRMDQFVRNEIASIGQWLAAAKRFISEANFALLGRLPGNLTRREELAALTISRLDALLPTTVAVYGTTASNATHRATGSTGSRSHKVQRHARRAAAQARAGNPFIDL